MGERHGCAAFIAIDSGGTAAIHVDAIPRAEHLKPGGRFGIGGTVAIAGLTAIDHQHEHVPAILGESESSPRLNLVDGWVAVVCDGPGGDVYTIGKDRIESSDGAVNSRGIRSRIKITINNHGLVIGGKEERGSPGIAGIVWRNRKTLGNGKPEELRGATLAGGI